jgi:hypothetical protein
LAQARLPPGSRVSPRTVASEDPNARPADASSGRRACTQPLGNSFWQSLSFVMDTGAMEDVVDLAPRLIAFGETLFGLFFVSVLISVGTLTALRPPARRQVNQPAA